MIIIFTIIIIIIFIITIIPVKTQISKTWLFLISPIFSKSRNRTLDRTRHVHVLLSCISEITIDFTEDA